MFGRFDRQEALRCNDPLKIHRQMALNFEQSGQFEQAENLYKVMQKKFGKHDRSVWLNSCAFYVKNSKLDTARNVFQKALTCLPKKDRKLLAQEAQFVSWPSFLFLFPYRVFISGGFMGNGLFMPPSTAAGDVRWGSATSIEWCTRPDHNRASRFQTGG